MTTSNPTISFIIQRLLRYGMTGLDAACYPFPPGYHHQAETLTPLCALYMLTDFLLERAQPAVMPGSPPEDALFDGVMALCDAAQPYKPVVQVLWDELWVHPVTFLQFSPYLRVALLTWARRHSVFVAQTLAEELILGRILGKTFLSWLHDDTPDQSATMVTLDHTIKQLVR